MRLLRFLAAAGCVSLLSIPSYALSLWPGNDTARLNVAADGTPGNEHLTGVASDGYYGTLIGWERTDDGRVYAQLLDPTGTPHWDGMTNWTTVAWTAAFGGWIASATPAGDNNIDPGEAEVITVTTADLSALGVGPNTELVTVSDGAGNMRDAVLAVVVYVYSGAQEADVLEFVPGRVEFEAESGSTTAQSQTVWLSVSGAAAVDWSGVDDQPWLSLDVTSGTITPGTNEAILLTADPSTLADGTYTAIVTVTDDAAVVRGAVLVATLYVGPPKMGSLQLNPKRLEFRRAQGAGTESGTSSLAGPSVSVFTGATTQTELAVGDDSLRGGYCAWVDARDGEDVIYLQHIDSDGDHVGLFKRMDVLASEDATILMGKLDFTDGSAAVTGTNTVFTREVGTGYIIRPENSANWYTVASVGGDFSLTLDAPVALSDAGTGLYATVVPYSLAQFSKCHTPKVLANNAGCFVAYLNDTLGLTSVDPITVPLLQMTYISDEGERLWTTDIDFPHPNTEYELHDDGAEGVLVIWHVPPYVDPDRILNDAGASFAVRIDADGEGVWGADPVLLFRRRNTVADTYYDRNEGVLWVAGPWWFNDEDKVSEADNGSYVVVNKLLSSGSWAWGEWTKGFEWDSKEKGRANTSALGDLTLPMYDDFNTDQRTAGITGDGMGGAHVLIKDNRMTDSVGPPITDYHDPYQNLYAQHVSFEGKIDWMWADERIKWNEDKSEYYIIYSLLGVPRYYEYPWIEGALVYRNAGSTVKDHTRAICDPWPSYNPVPGNRLASTITAVWTEDYVPAVPPLYDAIRLVQLDIFGGRLDWDDVPATVTPVLEVCSNLNNLPAAQFRFKSISDERYGLTIVWEENGEIYAKHCNYYQMYNDLRADPIGLGPDIFPPPPVTDFSAAAGIGYVTLTWTNPPGGPKPLEDFAGVMIRRSTADYPGTEEQGDWVYEGPLEEFIDTNVEAGLTYYYSAFAYDTELGIRNFSGPRKDKETIDFGDVKNFQAYGTDDEVYLNWENPGGTQYVGVRIRRSTVDFPPAYNDPGSMLIGDFPDTVISHTDPGLDPGVIYYYTAFAYNAVPVYTDGVTAFAVPLQGVTIDSTDVQSGTVNLDLTMPTGAANYEGVIVRRSETGYPATETDGEDAGVIDKTVPSPHTHADTGLTNYTTYYYSVFAHYSLGDPINDDVYTAPAQVMAVPGDFDPPPPVSNFSVTSGEDGQVPMSWDNPASALDWDKVVVRRSTADDITDASSGTFVYQQLNDGTMTTTHTDFDPTNGDTYYYVAFSIDAAGNETASPTLSATPIDITPPDMPSLIVTPVILTPGLGQQEPAVRVVWSINDTVAPNLDLRTADDPVAILRAHWDAGTLPADPQLWYPSGPTDDGTGFTGKNVVLVDTGGSASGNTDEEGADGIRVGVTYYYAAWAIDDESPANVSPRATAFATAVDNFAPLISNVTVTLSGPVAPVPTGAKPWQSYEALVEWTVTDLDTTRFEIDHGTTTGYHSEPAVADATMRSDTDRQATLTHLWGGTTFYFKITMTDSKGASATYEGSFTTTLTAGEDTDSDGMNDEWELDYFVPLGGDLTTADATSNYVGEVPNPDGLSDLEEYHHQTDPTKADTDGDGVTDDVEIANGSNPLKAPGSPLSFREGCGAASGGAPMALALVMLGAALSALRRRREGQT